MLKSKVIDEEIRLRLSTLVAYVGTSNKLNLQDINVFSEELVGQLLNIVYGLKLSDLNTYDDHNYPGIDLGDKDQQLCFQVTSTDKRTKIQETIKSFEKNHLKNDYTKLKFFIIKNKTINYRKKFATNGQHEFDAKDIISINDLVGEIRRLPQEKRIEVHDQLKNEINLGKSNYVTAEVQLLKWFFKEVSRAEISEADERALSEFDSGDIDVKKDRFEEFWSHLIQMYDSLMDRRTERIFSSIANSMSESERVSIERYLRSKSMRLLLDEENPIKLIETMKTQMLDELSINLISDVEVHNFLYYQFFRCNVLPNKKVTTGVAI